MIKGSNEYSKIWNRSLVLWYLILFNNYLRCTKAWLRSRCFQLKSRERIMTKAEKQITTRLKHFGGVFVIFQMLYASKISNISEFTRENLVNCNILCSKFIMKEISSLPWENLLISLHCISNQSIITPYVLYES